MKNLLSIIVIFLFATAIATEATAQSFKVIVNESNATGSVSQDELSEIFLKTQTKWDDGTPIEPVDLKANSEVREDFSQEIHGRGVGAIRNHWQQAAFSGKGSAPLEKGSDAEVIDFVKVNEGAVGYISSSAEATGVKVLSVN